MTQTEEKKQRRPLRGLLVASLAVNLAVVGIVGGALIAHHRFDGKDGPRGSERYATPYVKALSHEDRRAVGRSIWRSYRDGGVGVRGDKALYRETVALLRAETFDVQALDTALHEIDVAAEGRRELAREKLVAHIAAMTQQERAAYADRLEDVLSRGPDKDGKHKKGDKDRDGQDKK